MTKTIILAVSIVFLLGLVGLVGVQNYKQIVQGRAAAQTENLNRMARLRNVLDTAAAGDSSKFLLIVGNGICLDATYLRGLLLDSELSAAVSNDVIDSWGHPFHLRFSRSVTNDAPGGVCYDVFIWSDGANGVNENGQWDDIHSRGFTIICPTNN